jgi:exonuclease III
MCRIVKFCGFNILLMLLWIYNIKVHLTINSGLEPNMHYYQQFNHDLLSQYNVKNTKGIDRELYNRLQELGICAVKPTKRGCRAGTKLRRPIPCVQPSVCDSVNINKQNGVNWDNLITIQSVNNQTEHSTSAPRSHFALLNARSVAGKETHISDFILDNSLHILAVTETWFKGNDRDKHSISQLIPPGYAIEQNPRKKRGGGVALIYHKGLTVKKSKEMCEVLPSFETLDCVVTNELSTRVIVVYRPPPSAANKLTPSQFLTDFAIFLEYFASYGGNMLIVGDFNIHVNSKEDTYARQFLCLVESYGYYQHVDCATHQRGHTLDLVLTRQCDVPLITDISVMDPVISDHFAVMGFVSLSKPEHYKQVVTYRKVKSVDMCQFTKLVAESKIGDHTHESCDVLTSRYNEVLTEILDDVAPQKTRVIVVRTNEKWFNEDIRSAKQQRRRLERLYHKTRLEVHKQMLREQRNVVNKLIVNAKREHYSELIEGSADSKTIFSVANELLGNTHEVSLPDHVSVDDVLSRFSDFFITKIKLIQDSIQATSSDAPIHEVYTISQKWSTFKPVTVESVHKLIRSSPNKTNQLNPIPTSLVKAAGHTLAPIITRIIQASLNEGHVPLSLKVALVSPLIKKATLDCNNLKNYRPVSNLTYVSKIMEKVVASQLKEHLVMNNVMEPFQSAYCTGRSTESALLRVQNDIVLALANQKAVLLVLLDLSAAFDTVDHELMLSTLSTLHIEDTVLRWFRSYLTDRVQYISIGNKRSDSKHLTCGVPQGSVLGPVLFTIYTQSLGVLLRKLNIAYHLYADDTQLYITFDPSSVEDTARAVQQMETCVKLVKSWMTSHHLKMNDSKTEILVISSKRADAQLSKLCICDHDVLVSKEARNIGVIFDSHATMLPNIKSVCQKSFWKLKNISKLRPFLNKKALEILVHAFITCNLDIFNSLYLGLPQYSLNMLQAIQNTAARIITGTKLREHITPELKKLHWLPVQQRVKFKTLVFVFKCIHGLAPAYLKDLLQVRQQKRVLRSSVRNDLYIPFTKSTLARERSFECAGPRLWNSLPCSIQQVETLPAFKAQLKTFLFVEYYGI